MRYKNFLKSSFLLKLFGVHLQALLFLVLASAMNKLEIWNKEKYQQFFDSISADEFSILANEVMNKIFTKNNGNNYINNNNDNDNYDYRFLK